MLLCHPLIATLWRADKEQIDLKALIRNNSSNRQCTLNGSGTCSVQEARVQLSRYRFLKKQGYFRPVKPINLEGLITPKTIEDNLGTIKQVIFETTEDCNLDCVYCIYSKYYINRERGKREFRFSDARRMLALILSRRSKAAGKELIVSFYGGEPLKNIGFIRQVVEFCKAPEYQGIRFRFTMSSNGLLLERYAGFLAENQMEVSISLDGDSEGNRFRVLKNNKPSHPLVVKNIDAVRERYPEYFDKNISFLTVLHNSNSYGSVYAFFTERYNKTPLISTINTLNINKEYADEFRETFLDKRRTDPPGSEVMKKMFLSHPGVLEVADNIEKYSGFVFKNYYQVISSKSRSKGDKHFLPTATCLPFSMRVFLSADGSILPCEHISRIFEIGQYDDNNITITPDTIAQMYNDLFGKIKTFCSACLIADHCKECVFNTGIETGNPTCEFFTDEPRFTAGLARVQDIIERDPPFYERIMREAFYEK